MRLGIIGFSKYFQRAYLPVIQSSRTIKLPTVCDVLNRNEFYRLISKANLRQIPKLFHSIERFVSSNQIDAAIISTPHIFHYNQVKYCLESGLHVLVDKPLATKEHEVIELVEIADKKGLKLGVGNNRRYEEIYKYIKEAIAKEKYGEIKIINYLFANSPWYDYSCDWRGDPELNAGGALMDIGYLAVDMLIWLLDSPLCLLKAVGSHSKGYKGESSICILANSEPDTLVNLTVTYEAPSPSVQEELSIYGSRGSIFVRRFNSERSVSPPMVFEQVNNGKMDSVRFTMNPDCSAPLVDFLDSIKTNRPMIAEGKTTIPTIEFIGSVYSSIK